MATPAPVKLRRLFALLLFLVLTLNAGSLTALLRTQRLMLEMDQGTRPLLMQTQQLISTALSARLELYRHLADFASAGTAEEAVDSFRQQVLALLTEPALGESDLPEGDREALASLSAQLVRLNQMALRVRETRRWEELSLMQRQLEEAAGQALSIVTALRDRLEGELGSERLRLLGIMQGMRTVFVLSLAAALIIALGMYLVWKRFETSVLGL